MINKIVIALITIVVLLALYAFYFYKSIDLKTSSLDTECFLLNDSHLDDLKQMLVSWNPIEDGAPMIDTSIIDIIFPGKLGSNESLNTRNKWAINKTLLQIYVHSATLAHKTHTFKNPFYQDKGFNKLINNIPEIIDLYKNEQIRFNFTEEHEKLLRSVDVEFNNFIVGINPKRPYGDATFFALDIADILEIKYSKDSNGKLTPITLVDEMMTKHYELLPALQAFLLFGETQTGEYCRTSPYSQWKLLKK